MKKTNSRRSFKQDRRKQNVRESEERFLTMMENSPLSIQIFDPDGWTLRVNSAWERLWAGNRKEVEDYNILEDKQLESIGLTPSIKKAFAGETVWLPETYYDPAKIGKKGRPRFIAGHIHPLVIKNGKPSEVALVHYDVTDRKIAEESLRESEEYFRSSFEQTAIGMAHVGLDGKWLRVNQKLCTMLGYSKEEMLSHSFQNITHPDDLEKSLEAVKTLQSGKKDTHTFEKRYFKKDGTVIWANLTISTFRNPDGSIRHFISAIEDITERKNVEEETQYQKSLLELQQEVSPLGILIVSPDGKILKYNQRFSDMWHFPKEVMETELDDVALTAAKNQLVDPQAFLEKVLYCYQNKVQNHEKLSFKDGRVFERYGSPVIGKNESYLGYVWYFLDVTESEQLARQKDEFIGVASHELKTPVTSAKTFAQVLQNRFTKAGDERSAILLKKMDGQLSKLNTLIADLLDVTRLDTGKIQFNTDYFDFNELVAEIVEEMQRTTETHKIVSKLDKTKTICADRDRTGQVLINLISNAAKYSPNSKKIIVSTKIDSKHITACVRDFGVGISKENQNKLFERFFRASGLKEGTFPGIGLGLYISAEIVRRQKGKIWVKSKEGKGSTFCFSLPINKEKIKRRSSKS